jgi:hypothetical protein
MRRVFGKSRLNAYFRGGLLAVTLAIASTHRGDKALGQSQYPPATGQGNGRPPFGAETDATQDPMLRHAEEEAAKRRNIDRQSKLVADSSRILQLANELSTGIEPEGKNPTSAAMSKKAEEIEKLARSVKDLMKSP